MKTRDYIYLVVAIFLSTFLVVTYSLYIEFKNDFYESQAYEDLKGNKGEAAIKILEEAREYGSQKNTFQIHISSRLGIECKRMNRFNEAEKYLNEVVFMKTKLIGNSLYDLAHYNSLKNTACLELARIHLDKGNYERAKYFIDLSSEFPMSFGCGTGAMRHYSEVTNLTIEYAMDVGDIELLISELQMSLLKSNESSKALSWLIKLMKTEYSKEEIQRELSNLEDGIREMEIEYEGGEVPSHQYKTKFYGVEIIIANDGLFMWDNTKKYEDYCDSINSDATNSYCKIDYLRYSLRKSYFYNELVK